MVFPGIDPDVSTMDEFEFHNITGQKYWSL